MTRRTRDALPGLKAFYPFRCPRCDRERPQGARMVYVRGVPTCVECVAGADE